MYDIQRLSKEEYMKLNSIDCKNKVVFTDNQELDLEFAYYIKPNPNAKLYQGTYLDRDEKTLTTLEKNFDFVEWLNK